MTRGTLGLLLMVLVAACSGPLTMIAPEPPASYVTTGPAKGSACGCMLFNLIPIGVNGRAGRAYASALRDVGAGALTDVEVTERWYYAYVASIYCTDIAGVGVRAP